MRQIESQISYKKYKLTPKYKLVFACAMCGRSSISKKEADLEKRFKARFYSEYTEKYNPLPIYNVCPTTYVPVIANNDKEHFQYFHWGMNIQSRDGTLRKNVINARIEHIQKIPQFSNCLAMHRCIVPATSYFEWKTIDKHKIPYLIHWPEVPIFSLAGIYVQNTQGPGSNKFDFVLITKPPTAKLSYIHNRMPLILSPQNEQQWLDTSVPPTEALQLANSADDMNLQFYTVSKEINRSFANRREYIQEKPHELDIQGQLF